MSGIIWVIIVGFIAGILARLVSPGQNNPNGFILTTVLGIAGAFLATLVGQAIGHYGPDQGAGFVTATIGAVVVLFIWNRLVASGTISDPGKDDRACGHSEAQRENARNFEIPGPVPVIIRRASRRITRSDAFPHPSARPRRSCCPRPATPGSRPVARYPRLRTRSSAALSPPPHHAPAWRQPRRGPW